MAEMFKAILRMVELCETGKVKQIFRDLDGEDACEKWEYDLQVGSYAKQLWEWVEEASVDSVDKDQFRDLYHEMLNGQAAEEEPSEFYI